MSAEDTSSVQRLDHDERNINTLVIFLLGMQNISLYDKFSAWCSQRAERDDKTSGKQTRD